MAPSTGTGMKVWPIAAPIADKPASTLKAHALSLKSNFDIFPFLYSEANDTIPIAVLTKAPANGAEKPPSFVNP